MKILYYSPHPNLTLASPSGPGTHMREVIEALENQGHQVIQFIAGDKDKRFSGLSQFKTPWYKGVLKFITPDIVWQSLKDWDLERWDARNSKELEAMIIQHKPDVIYERAHYMMKAGVRIAKRFNIPLIIEMNAPYSEEKIYLEGNSLYIEKSKQCEKEQIEGASVVYVVSSALSNYFKAQYPSSEKRIIITPNAINPKKAHANPSLKASLKAQYRLRKDEVVIGFVGSIFKYHGVDRLLEAFANLVNEHPEKSFRLLVVGDGMVLPDLKKIAIKLGVNKKVIFFGNVPHRDVYTYIDLMDIAVMASSNWYGSPVKVFEYGAMSKAIVAPDNVPMRDVMVNGTEGILVNDGLDEVFNALNKLVFDDTLRLELAKRFHDKVEKQYTWDIVALDIAQRARAALKNNDSVLN
jgi:glycosyltransferase involved in cell wall biosynthesis